MRSGGTIPPPRARLSARKAGSDTKAVARGRIGRAHGPERRERDGRKDGSSPRRRGPGEGTGEGKEQERLLAALLDVGADELLGVLFEDLVDLVDELVE